MKHLGNIKTLWKGNIIGVSCEKIEPILVYTPDGHEVKAWKDKDGDTYLASCGMGMNRVGTKFLDISSIKILLDD